MDKCLDLTGMESTTHLEIIKRLIDQISMHEKRILVNYIKTSMKPPQPTQPPTNHTVHFSFK